MKEINNIVRIIFLSMIIFSCQSDYENDIISHDNFEIEKRQRYISEYLQDDACVTYFIRGTCTGNYLTAINNSVNLYNNIPGTSLDFAAASSEAAADIVFDCGAFGQPCLGGEAILGEETNGDVADDQTLIQINTNGMNCCDASNPVPFTLCQQQVIVTHELGHGIGFAHTNAAPIEVVSFDEYILLPDGSVEYINPVFLSTTKIPGTPGSDANSIFNTGTLVTPLFCNGGCPELSSADIEAIQILYPGCRCECEIGHPEIYYEQWTEYIECDEECSIPAPYCIKYGDDC